MKHTFIKAERLSRYSLIRKLFSEGSSFSLSPFRVTWLDPGSEKTELPRILISVPKYNIQKANDRNLIKRRIREAYRLNKQVLFCNNRVNPQKLLVCITYSTKEMLSYDIIQAKIILLLQRLSEENEKLTR